MNNILTYADSINKIESNTYFVKLKNNPNLKSFGTSQMTFIKAVEMWSNILALIFTKLKSPSTKLLIVENLYDEFGNGDINNCHVNTFAKLLSSVGNDGHPVSTHHVDKFNNEIYKVVNEDDLAVSVAMLGMIEYTYIKVSKCINDYLSSHFEQNEIFHYTLHEVLDIKHSLDLFRIVEPDVDTNLDQIKIGIKKGYDIMYELYSGLSVYLDS